MYKYKTFFLKNTGYTNPINIMPDIYRLDNRVENIIQDTHARILTEAA